MQLQAAINNEEAQSVPSKRITIAEILLTIDDAGTTIPETFLTIDDAGTTIPETFLTIDDCSGLFIHFYSISVTLTIYFLGKENIDSFNCPKIPNTVLPLPVMEA